MANKKYLFFLLVTLFVFNIIIFAGAYPEKNITNIIPWSAGGGTDAAIRGIMHYAEKQLGVTIVNQNITGAQSGIGIFRLMISRPDGYTIGALTWDSAITVPYYNLVPSYDMDKLDFIGTVTDHPTVLAVRSDSLWKTLEDFVNDAKNRPGEILISNAGAGGVNHLPMLDMADVIGIDVSHVPYPKGSAPQRESLLSGETDAASISVSTAMPGVQAGNMRVLAVMAEERSKSLPDVPTFKELGYDVVWGSFRLIAVPKGVPEEIQVILEEAFYKIFEDEEFLEWATKTGLGATWKNREETKVYVRSMQNKAYSLIDDLIERGILEKVK